MTRAFPIALVAVTAGLSTCLRAQICTGSTSFARAPIQLTGAFASNSDGSSYSAGLGAGGRGLFGQAAIGRTQYDDFDASSSDLGVGLGYQFPFNPQHTGEICPLVSWQHGSGPNDVDLFGQLVDLSSTVWVFGFAVGGVVSGARSTQIVPAGSIALAKTKVNASTGGASSSNTDNLGVFELGVGFVFNQTFALHPSFMITFGLDNTTTTLGVNAALSLARRRSN